MGLRWWTADTVVIFPSEHPDPNDYYSTDRETSKIYEKPSSKAEQVSLASPDPISMSPFSTLSVVLTSTVGMVDDVQRSAM